MKSPSTLGDLSSHNSPDLDEISARAVRIYEARLRSRLEAECPGRIVAIHSDSGDYAVGKNSPAARRALRERRRDGAIVTMSIGPDRPEPALDRILGTDS